MESFTTDRMLRDANPYCSLISNSSSRKFKFLSQYFAINTGQLQYICFHAMSITGPKMI